MAIGICPVAASMVPEGGQDACPLADTSLRSVHDGVSGSRAQDQSTEQSCHGLALKGEKCSWAIFQASLSLTNTMVERARSDIDSPPASKA